MEEFRFKKFSIYRDPSVFPVTTDSVIFGAWINIGLANSILDIGCGTGIIAVFLASKSKPQIQITAIDNQIEACMNTKYNLEKSHSLHNFEVIHSEFQFFQSGTYDLIVTNPPYFHNNLKNQNIFKSNQRHQHQFNYTELISKMCSLLTEWGRINIVVPIQYTEEIINEHLKHNLFLVRRLTIKHTIDADYSIVLLEFSKLYANFKHESIILFDSTGERTAEFNQLVAAYYL